MSPPSNASGAEALRKLIKHVNNLSDYRGGRAELARFLGVDASIVTRYLEHKIVPGGEAVLLLQQWAAEKESQQTKEPARVRARTGRMAQLPTSHANAKRKKPDQGQP
jgi:hypothetical protein